MHSSESGTYGAERPRVLIAEDDTITRLILKHWIQRWGYEVVVVDNGQDAWQILQQERPPEVVIIDWGMPGIDGIELCRRLRDKSRSYYHYILMVTGRTEELDVVHALESGADDCLGKPFAEPELRARLLVATRILALQNELIHAREELRAQAMRDGLTGLWNRTAFLDLCKHELDRAARTNGRTGLLMLDLDNFKLVNDTYGHLAGDLVLKEAARRLSQNVRSYDFVGRFGGEEFFVAFPGLEQGPVMPARRSHPHRHLQRSDPHTTRRRVHHPKRWSCRRRPSSKISVRIARHCRRRPLQGQRLWTKLLRFLQKTPIRNTQLQLASPRPLRAVRRRISIQLRNLRTLHLLVVRRVERRCCSLQIDDRLEKSVEEGIAAVNLTFSSPSCTAP